MTDPTPNPTETTTMRWAFRLAPRGQVGFLVTSRMFFLHNVRTI